MLIKQNMKSDVIKLIIKTRSNQKIAFFNDPLQNITNKLQAKLLLLQIRWHFYILCQELSQVIVFKAKKQDKQGHTYVVKSQLLLHQIYDRENH